ncbi:Peptidyl-prolyl cis-trans isomerase fpr2 [Ascochyta clinopodiicola]|nr:Peptidyl-prolyl cis-trans isomerase fpr2 [Ascochyta clinopodiicola]
MKLTAILALATAAFAGETINNEVPIHPSSPSPSKLTWQQHLKTEVVTAVDYRGTLASDGSEFDASYNRGQPLSFKVGSGQVIKGWDQGLLDMCPGEKRKLTIQPEWAYGSRGAGPIPANSVLIFETELVSIDGVSKDEL